MHSPQKVPIESIENDECDFEDNYQYRQGTICRRVAYSNCIRVIEQVRGRMSQIQLQKQKYPDSNAVLTVEDIPNIKFEDSSLELGRKFIEDVKTRENSEGNIKYSDAFASLIKVNKYGVILCVLGYLFENLFRLAFSVALYYLFVAITNRNLDLAYGLVVVAVGCILMATLGRHFAFYEAAILNNRIRALLITSIYNQIINKSQYTIKNAQLGKINNMLAGDFANIQFKVPILFTIIYFPVVIIALVLIMGFLFSWKATVSVAIAILFTPLASMTGKINGTFLTQVNVHKDARIKITTQIIEGIKFIKIYGWEIAFTRIIQNLRQAEIHSYVKMAFGRALEKSIANSAALVAGFSALVLMQYTGDSLTTAVIFSIMELMVYLKLQMFFVMTGIGFIFQFNIILERFANIYNIKNTQMIRIDPIHRKPILTGGKPLATPKNRKKQIEMTEINLDITLEVNDEVFESEKINKGDIVLKYFNGYWGQNLEQPTLKDINLRLHANRVYGIGGKIGSGKSALIGVLLKQIPYYSGNLQIEGSVAYVEQEPVIFSATIRENIIFGQEFNERLYERALQGSCLHPDLKILQDGDRTVVGQKGMTLSGGQKARLAFARALYSDADIYLLDDPISAVDSKVAKGLFYDTIRKLLKEKTVVLVTHQINYLQECDQVIIMENGRVKCKNSPKYIQQQLQQLSAIFKHLQEQKQNSELHRQMDEIIQVEQERNIYGVPDKLMIASIQELPGLNLMKLPSIKKLRKSSMDARSAVSQTMTNRPKIQQSKQQKKVQVKLKSYSNFIFFNKVNYWLFPLALFLYLGNEGINTLFFRFLANYDAQKNHTAGANFASINEFWLTLGLIQGGYFILLFLKYAALNLVILKSNEAMHRAMIEGTVRSPASFFDITPSGQLINKFSNDLGVLDNTLVHLFNDCTEMPIIMIIMAINIFQINPYFSIVGVISIAFMVVYFIYCKKPTIQVKQLDLKNRSPMFSMLNQMASGLVQLTIYKRKLSNFKEFTQKVNRSFRCNLSVWMISRVFGVYLSYLSNLFIFLGLILGIVVIVQVQGNPNTGLYGISAVFLIQINDLMQWFLRQLINLESTMVSTQRAFQIVHLEPEAQIYTEYDRSNGIPPPKQHQLSSVPLEHEIREWPQKPCFSVKNLSMRYRPELPLILRNVSFEIKPGEKVGIVGRTGAGKSSIIQVLFRIAEPGVGTIYQIDNTDVLQMGLHSLRQNMSVIPQTPFLFKGSIRQNLDPFDIEKERVLWSALQQSGLKEYVFSLRNKLDTQVSNTSDVFSVGQKQLLCLARALIRRSKILFLDQATSNVDMNTDDFIQRVLKEKFTQTTIITIAHRLNTIADYDQIIVMDNGRVKETGTPHQLLQKKELFYDMVMNSGKSADKILLMAKDSHTKKKNIQRALTLQERGKVEKSESKLMKSQDMQNATGLVSRSSTLMKPLEEGQYSRFVKSPTPKQSSKFPSKPQQSKLESLGSENSSEVNLMTNHNGQNRMKEEKTDKIIPQSNLQPSRNISSQDFVQGSPIRQFYENGKNQSPLLPTNRQLFSIREEVPQMMKKETSYQSVHLAKSLLISSRKQKINKYYVLEQKQLGRGAFGVVYRGHQKDNYKLARAIKKINWRILPDKNQLIRQINILKELDHPNVIRLYEEFEDQNSIYLVTDLCEGGQLFDRLDQMGYFSQKIAKDLFRQIVDAVYYCHCNRVAHRDLKPENFLFMNQTSMSMKLIDFGVSFEWKSNMNKQLKMEKASSQFVGTSYYIAPEIIKCDYDQRCDIWSMGVILYTVVSGVPPFNGQDDQEIMQNVSKMEYSMEIPEFQNISPELKDLIAKMLLCQEKRISLKEIYNHPWMTQQARESKLKINFSGMKQFARSSKLKKLTATYIATQLSGHQIEALGELFKEMDTDHDGTLSIQQLRAALKTQKDSQTIQELEELISSLDTDQSGTIDYNEFIASTMDRKCLASQNHLLAVFKMLDGDGNGFIDKEQLIKVFEKNGADNLVGNEIDEIIKQCDLNGDGKIDFQQFKQAIRMQSL